jgi:hypothetical protein
MSVDDKGVEIPVIELRNFGYTARFIAESLFNWVSLVRVGDPLRRVSALLKHTFSLKYPLTIKSEVNKKQQIIIHHNGSEIVKIDQPNWYLQTDM